MRRRSTVTQLASWKSFIARDTVSRLAPIICAIVWCVSGLSIVFGSGFLGEVEQQARDAARHVEQHEAADLLVGAAQAARQLGEQRPRDGRRRLDAPAEILAAQHEQMRILHRDDVRRARPVVDERELAEMLADAEHAEDHLASVLADEHDFDAALADDEQRVAGIVLEQDDAAARIELLARQLAEALELDPVEAAEERHRRQEVGSWWWRSRAMGEGRESEAALRRRDAMRERRPSRQRREVSSDEPRCQTATHCRACLLRHG